MTPNSPLFLPGDVLRHGVLPFLSLKNLVELDSSICERNARNQYFSSLAGYVVDTRVANTTERARWLMERNTKLKHFTLNGQFDAETISHFRPLLSGLQSLTIVSSASNDALYELVYTVVFDTLLKFSILAPKARWEENTLMYLLSNQSKIRSVTLQAGGLIMDHTLHAIASYCPLLESLEVDCPLMEFSDAVVAQLLTACTQLTSLQLCGAAVRDSTLQLIGQHGASVKKVSLWRCDSVTNAGLLAVVSGVARLDSLHIAGCARVTAAGVRECGNRCVVQKSM